jgi:glycosyltransferase involved in cell wall biosynthesis
MPAISVIVPTRGRNHLLPRCLASLVAQTHRDFEVILVDDNGPADRVTSSPAVAPFLEDPRVRVLAHAVPRNAASARNCGLEHARGEWIAYLDDDDAYRPEKLSKQHEKAQVTGLPVGLCGMTFHLLGRTRTTQVGVSEISGEGLLLSALPAPFVLFHRRADVRFEERLDAGEDAHFFLSLVAHFDVWRVFNVPEALVDVFPQAGPRVNLNAAGQRDALREILTDLAPRYGAGACEAYRLRSELAVGKVTGASPLHMIAIARKLVALRGLSEARFILNSLLYLLPPARRFLVS